MNPFPNKTGATWFFISILLVAGMALPLGLFVSTNIQWQALDLLVIAPYLVFIGLGLRVSLAFLGIVQRAQTRAVQPEPAQPATPVTPAARPVPSLLALRALARQRSAPPPKQIEICWLSPLLVEQAPIFNPQAYRSLHPESSHKPTGALPLGI